MRMLGYLLRFLAILLLIRFVLRAVALWLRPRPASTPAAPAHDLVRDRVCNTFVARDRAVKALVNGQEEHFCSATCRDKALVAGSRAAS